MQNTEYLFNSPIDPPCLNITQIPSGKFEFKAFSKIIVY